MILINLLPYREARRLARKRAFFAGLVASAVAGLGLVVFGLSFVTQLTSQQETRNEYLRAEVKKLEAQIRDIATLRVEIDAVKARQRAIDDLQKDRHVPVHLLHDLVTHVPHRPYLTAVRPSGGGGGVMGVRPSQ